MTTIIMDLVRRALSSDPFAYDMARVDLLVIVLLIALLAEREMWRAASSTPTDRRSPATSVLIQPLLTVFAIVLVARLASLLT